ncbi:MAG: methyltransferase domain-containing protein [Deltaproteobacteria bacterium]|nr:methyltransferase domain-containing protein [Deltaproteobacteria bacterium]
MSATVGIGSAAVTVLAWATAPFLGVWLAPEYGDSVETLRVLLAMVPLVACGSVFGNAFLALGDVRRFVLPIAAGVVTGALACAALVPALGVRGAAWALVAAQLTVVVTSVLAFLGARPRGGVAERPAVDPHVPLGSGCRIVEVDATDPSHARHLARYRFASRLRGGVWLDAACGSGYGTELLAGRGSASRLVGVDLSVPALACARERAPQPPAPGTARARYLAADVTALPVASRSVDVVVSFETIEHVADVDAYLAELTRVLKDDGTVTLSTPNRRFSSPWRGPRRAPRNHFHRVEWTPREFFALLEGHFREVEELGQVPIASPRLHEARCFVRGLFDWAIARTVHRVTSGARVHGALRRVYRGVLGADPAVVGAAGRGDGCSGRAPRVDATETDRFAVRAIPDGHEPLVMVAVCRRPRPASRPVEHRP